VSARRPGATLLGLALAIIAPLLPSITYGGDHPSDEVPAHSNLTPDDEVAIRGVPAALGDGFKAGDVEACLRLIYANAPRLKKITRSLRREFEQFCYQKFEIEWLAPEDSFANERHSVQVSLRLSAQSRAEDKPATNARGVHEPSALQMPKRKFEITSAPLGVCATSGWNWTP